MTSRLFRQAIKAARKAKGHTRRFRKSLTSHAILFQSRTRDSTRACKCFYELVTFFDISVDQFSSRIKHRTKAHSVVNLMSF